MLIPYNVFITAQEFFAQSFRHSPYQSSFQNYFLFLLTFLNLVFVLVAMLRQHRAHFSRQIILANSVQILIFSALILLTLVDIPPSLAFWCVVALLCVSTIAVSFMQNAVFAVCAHFAPVHIQAVMSGQGLAGIAASLAPLLIALPSSLHPATTDSPEEVSARARYYFLTATLVSTLSLFAYLLLLRTNTYQSLFFSPLSPPHKHPAILADKIEWKSMGKTLRRIQSYAFAILLCFIVTLSLFPAITANTQPINTARPGYIWSNPLMFMLLHFVVFNCGDFLGRYVPILHHRLFPSSPRKIVVFSMLRLVFIPLFLLCHTERPQSGERVMPVVFGDAAFMVFVALFAITNGWCGASCFMAAPDHAAAMLEQSLLQGNQTHLDDPLTQDEPLDQAVKGKEMGMAAMVLSCVMTLGLAIGGMVSFGVRAAVCQCDPF